MTFPFLRNITHHNTRTIVFLSICPEASVVGDGLEGGGGVDRRRKMTAGRTTLTSMRKRTEESVEMQAMK